MKVARAGFAVILLFVATFFSIWGVFAAYTLSNIRSVGGDTIAEAFYQGMGGVAFAFFVVFISVAALVALPSIFPDVRAEAATATTAEQGKQCPYCGARLDPRAIKCRECGSAVVLTEDCPVCGAETPRHTGSCIMCGARLARCQQCAHLMPLDARTCPSCGQRVGMPPPPPPT
jgi:RNA polymerase subunit RPABC4/transcription elongation factor Spt4